MANFPLKVVSPDGVKFEGMVERLTLRTTSGDMGILAGHCNCVAPVGMGRATVVTQGQTRYAACIGGMVSVLGGNVTLTPTTFEWAEEIDFPRAEQAEAKALQTLEKKDASQEEIRLAQARLRRALVRKSVSQNK